MSIDRSLRLKDALVRHRNVLTRAERIEKLQDEEKWEDGRSVLGLPKVGHRKAHTKKVAKAKEEGARAQWPVWKAHQPQQERLRPRRAQKQPRQPRQERQPQKRRHPLLENRQKKQRRNKTDT